MIVPLDTIEAAYLTGVLNRWLFGRACFFEMRLSEYISNMHPACIIAENLAPCKKTLSTMHRHHHDACCLFLFI